MILGISDFELIKMEGGVRITLCHMSVFPNFLRKFNNSQLAKYARANGQYKCRNNGKKIN